MRVSWPGYLRSCPLRLRSALRHRCLRIEVPNRACARFARIRYHERLLPSPGREVVRVPYDPRYANENERGNRSRKGASSIHERLCPARTALTTQALLTRVNSGVESGRVPLKSRVRCQFGGRMHGAVPIWVPRLCSRRPNRHEGTPKQVKPTLSAPELTTRLRTMRRPHRTND